MTTRKRAKTSAAPYAGPAGERWRRTLLIALLALAFLLGCCPLSDFDVWWHLRTGQLILETGRIPHIDLYTYTNATRPWIDVAWLYEIALALLQRLGGVSALVLLKATANAAIVGLSMLGRPAGRPAWPLAVAWVPGLLMVSGRLSERPELISLVLLAAFLVVLARAAEAPRRLWLLPAFEVLWVNCHGFFVMGPLVLAAYTADWLLDGARPPATPAARPPAKLFAAVALLSLAACLANPYGVRAVGLALEQFHKVGNPGLYRATIGELKSTGDFIARAGLWNPYLLAGFATFALGLASFVACARRARLRLFRVLLFGAGAWLAWEATRNNGLFAVIAVFVTTWNFDDARDATPIVAPPPKSNRRRAPAAAPRRRLEPNAIPLGAVAVLALATLSGRLYAWAGEGRRIGLGERPHWFAHDACAFAARSDMPVRLVAYNISQAAVCIAHGAPAHKEFMDPRLEVNTEETFERYLAGIQRLWRGEPGWEQPLGIDYARPDEVPAILIERGPLRRAAEVLASDPRWRCVFADQLATVFVTADFAARHGLPAVALR